MGRQHIKGGFLTVRQGKTGATVVIPLHPELQAVLAASEACNLTFLTTATGKPFAPGAFTNWFGTLCRAAGLPLGLSAHGLRKAMCRRPCVLHQIIFEGRRVRAPPFRVVYEAD
jgi:hypothetical protein